MSIKAKATTNVVKRIDYKVNKTEHIQSYDSDNQYPQRVIDIINDSPTGKRCARLCAKFIMGGGFTDLDFYRSVINRRGMTVDGLLRKNAWDMSRFGSFALHVNYNALCEIVEVNFVHFANCRLSAIDDEKYRNKIALYDDWGRVKKKNIQLKDIDFIDVFNPDPEIINAQVEALTEYAKDGETIVIDGWSRYKGQVFVFGIIESWEYELAPCDEVLEDMQTEGRMKRFKLNSVDNNFLASHIFVTNEFENDEDREAFGDNIKQFQGAENTSGVMHFEKSDAADSIEIQKVEIQNYDGLYSFTEESCKNAIIGNRLIPPVLVLQTPGKLGTSKEIEDATAFYNGVTADERLVFEEVYEVIFSYWKEPINPTGDYSIIPYKSPKSTNQIAPEYFPYYTKNEIREANGDAPVLEANANDQLLAEKLQVGGTTALIALLTDPVLTPEQKIGTMEVLFGINTEDAQKMLAITLIPNPVR